MKLVLYKVIVGLFSIHVLGSTDSKRKLVSSQWRRGRVNLLSLRQSEEGILENECRAYSATAQLYCGLDAAIGRVDFVNFQIKKMIIAKVVWYDMVIQKISMSFQLI